MPTNPNALLAGFETVPAAAMPAITLDKQSRFYVNAALRSVAELSAYDHVTLLYSPDERKLALVKGRFENARPHTIDRRHYISARHFLRRYPISRPATFELAEADGQAFVFRMVDGD